MKSSKSEIVYFILTIMVLSVAGFLYVFFGNRHHVTQPATSELVQTKPKEKDEEQPADKPEDVRLAEEHLATFNNNLSAENLATAQAAIDIVGNPDIKGELQGKLNALATEMENQAKAEQLVVQAENFLSSANLEVAQEAVNTLTKEETKNQFQNRLNVVKQNIDAYNQANGLVSAN